MFLNEFPSIPTYVALLVQDKKLSQTDCLNKIYTRPDWSSFSPWNSAATTGLGLPIWNTKMTLQLIPAFPNFFGGNIFDVAEVYQRRWLEESGKWLEHVDQTHLVLAIGQPVLQKDVLIIKLLITSNSGQSSEKLWLMLDRDAAASFASKIIFYETRISSKSWRWLRKGFESEFHFFVNFGFPEKLSNPPNWWIRGQEIDRIRLNSFQAIVQISRLFENECIKGKGW